MKSQLISALVFIATSATSAISMASSQTTYQLSCAPVHGEGGAILMDYPSLGLEVSHIPMGPMLPAFSTEVTLVSRNFAWGGGQTERFQLEQKQVTDDGVQYADDHFTVLLSDNDKKATIFVNDLQGVSTACHGQDRVAQTKARTALLAVEAGHYTGYVTALVSVTEKTLTATLEGPKRLCIRAPCPQPEPVVVRLPIVDVEETSCGKIYFAQRDLRPVDGSLQILRLTDHSHALCKLKMMIPPEKMTVLEYKVESLGRGGPAAPLVSRFSGPALQ